MASYVDVHIYWITFIILAKANTLMWRPELFILENIVSGLM